MLKRIVFFSFLLLVPGITLAHDANATFRNAYIDIYNKSIESVVTVMVAAESTITREILENLPTDSPFNRLFEEDGQEITPRIYGSGSGFIVSEDGLVYTNHHVIAAEKPSMVVTSINVVWKSGEYRTATLIASDPIADFAILQIDKENEDETFVPVPLGDSDNITPGTMVAAIGSPLDHAFSITSGIISAVDRTSRKGRWVTYLQTDTVINKGNSGGPLFNLDGEVIGMNTLLVSPSGFYIGIGYAVPSNLFQTVARTLIAYGEYVRPWMGVSLGSPNVEFKEKIGLAADTISIVLLGVLPNGPAAASGLQKYDVIKLVDGKALNVKELIDITSASAPGDILKLDIRRVHDLDTGKYEDLTIMLVIGRMPDSAEF